MALGKRIKRKREAAQLTQEQLGHAIGVSRQHVSMWERDVVSPSIENIKKIAKALGAEVGALIK